MLFRSIALLIILFFPRAYALGSSPDSKEVDRIKVKICLLKSDEYCLNVELPLVERIVENGILEKLVWTVLGKLFEGPTKEEMEILGIYTVIPDGVKVISVKVVDGVAYIDLSKQLQNYGGGSFNAFYIREQIERTLKEFPSIEEVVITVEGKGEKNGILQP